MQQPEDKWDWVGAIETASGISADITNLTPEMVTIEDIALSLSNICRYNGHLPNFYSVAEHSVRVAGYLENEGCTPEIILTGLLHDAAEAYVGDMMRPLKRLPEMHKVFSPIENNVLKVLHEKFGGVFPHPEIIHTADHLAYDWEIKHIRTGLIKPLTPEEAYDMFLETFDNLMEAVHADNEVREEGIEDFVYDFNQWLDDIEKLEKLDKKTTPRRQILMEAAELIDGDRNVQYGDPNDDFTRISKYWSTHIGGVFRRKLHEYGVDDLYEYSAVLAILDNVLGSHDVAIMMGHVKDSRLSWDPYKRDTWADKAGYAGCGFDCVSENVD